MTDKFSNANSQYKDSLFRDFFNEPERLLNLCNALLDSKFLNVDDIEINTLESNFFSGLKNDISCRIGNQFLILVEHQSTINENMPVRCLTYVAELFNNLIEKKNLLYKQDRITLPAPKFFVFYDGDNKSEPVSRILKLSDAFNGDSSSLELIVHSININLGLKAEVLGKCKDLHDYSTLIFYIKEGLAKKLTRRNAIILAIQRCIDENIMREYLIQKREEVFSMLDFQWNLEDAKQAWLEQGIEQGRQEGHNAAMEAVAINMLQMDMSIESIQKVTNLPLQRIQELLKTSRAL